MGFGEIPTLGSLNLWSCNEYAAISSTKILEDQLSLGNEEIIQIDFRDKVELNSFMKKVDTTDFPEYNFDCSGSRVEEIEELHEKILIVVIANLQRENFYESTLEEVDKRRDKIFINVGRYEHRTSTREVDKTRDRDKEIHHRFGHVI